MNLDIDDLAAKKINGIAQKSITDKNLLIDKMSELIELQKSMMKNNNNNLEIENISGEDSDSMNLNEIYNESSNENSDVISIFKKLIYINEETQKSLLEFKDNISSMLSEQVILLQKLTANQASSTMTKSLNETGEFSFKPKTNTNLNFGGEHAKEVSLQHFGVEPKTEVPVVGKMAGLSKSMAYQLLGETFDGDLANEYQMRLTVVHHNDFEQFFDAQRTSIQTQILEKLQSTQN